MIFAWVGLSARLFQIMIIDSDEYRKQAFDQAQKHETLLPVRGNIYDRNGLVLAASISSKSLYSEANQINNIDLLSTKLEKILEWSLTEK